MSFAYEYTYIVQTIESVNVSLEVTLLINEDDDE